MDQSLLKGVGKIWGSPGFSSARAINSDKEMVVLSDDLKTNRMDINVREFLSQEQEADLLQWIRDLDSRVIPVWTKQMEERQVQQET